MKTIVYIDGFNLYFGSVKGTVYRWLDISSLVTRIIKDQNPNSEIIVIKYFTADIKSKLSRRGQDSCIAQQDYLLSLAKHIENIDIIKGKYIISEAKYHPFNDPVDFNVKHTVWRAEEKQTDVNIAIQMVCDSIDNNCDQIVLFSNDSDLSPALRVVKERNPEIIVGIVAPIRINTNADSRRPSVDLKKHSDWSRYGIREEELRNSQLPDRIITRKRVISKPQHW